MNATPVIQTRRLRKSYRVFTGHGRGWLKSVLVPGTADRFSKHSVALRDVDLTVGEGEVVGILGRNGSGKSTLLKLIAGMSTPSAGTVVVRGRMRCLMSSGVGFQSRLTGRQNILFGSVAMGVPRRTALARLDEIVAFAELEGHLDKPLMYYSAGMRSRLALAVAVQEAPEVLVLDEALAAGDAAFTRKCRDRFEAICATGSTVLIATHSVPFVRRACTRGLVLDGGRIAFDGAPTEASDAYEELLAQGASVGEVTPGARAASAVHMPATRTSVIVEDARLVDAAGEPVEEVLNGTPMVLRVVLRRDGLDVPVRLLLDLRNAQGQRVAQVGTRYLDAYSGRSTTLGVVRLPEHCELEVRWPASPLGTGRFSWFLTAVAVLPDGSTEVVLPRTELCGFAGRSFADGDWPRDVVVEPRTSIRLAARAPEAAGIAPSA